MALSNRKLTKEDVERVGVGGVGAAGAGETVIVDTDGKTAQTNMTGETFNDYRTRKLSKVTTPATIESGNVATGTYSHAEGQCTTASGSNSHAEGMQTIASGGTSHAEGDRTTASGYYSHAEGKGTAASGVASHAEGSETAASAYYSHAEGYKTTASGEKAHAEGSGTTASGANSHAEGQNTIASCSNQHVQGKNNIEDSSSVYAHIVGNGASATARSNAHTLDWSGNGWFAGTVEGTGVIVKSSTEGSTKRFMLTVDDSGTITATEVT